MLEKSTIAVLQITGETTIIYKNLPLSVLRQMMWDSSAAKIRYHMLHSHK